MNMERKPEGDWSKWKRKQAGEWKNELVKQFEEEPNWYHTQNQIKALRKLMRSFTSENFNILREDDSLRNEAVTIIQDFMDYSGPEFKILLLHKIIDSFKDDGLLGDIGNPATPQEHSSAGLVVG